MNRSCWCGLHSAVPASAGSRPFGLPCYAVSTRAKLQVRRAMVAGGGQLAELNSLSCHDETGRGFGPDPERDALFAVHSPSDGAAGCAYSAIGARLRCAAH